ncbi:hypothetical protein TNCV_4454171 [Trichonephila clavipes]|nr:hypothetical protein TNCV_4454171 [Trichonephila clavipes]
MAPVPIPLVLEPVPIPDVPPVQIPQTPVQIPDVLEPFQIFRGSRTCADSSVTRPTATYADSPRTYEHSTCICADSEDPEPVQIPVSHVPQPPMQILPEPMNILHVPQHVQIPVSHVPQPPMQVLHVSESVQIPVVPQPPVQIPNVPVQIPVSHVPPMQSLPEPVQIPVSHVPPVQSLPEPMQLLPELDMLDPLESTDAFDQLMSFVFGPQELQLLHTVPSIFDENLFSFLDEREPMDLTMPRLNSCVKNIAFKPIQPMDLSVNSGQ